MQRFCLNTYGLEYSKESVKICKKNGLQAFPGFIAGADYKLQHAPFDAFFILNFLEHLPKPNSILQGIRNNLTEDGIGLVEVPNFDMILQKKLFSEFIIDHLFYFTKETLNSTLWRNGFEIIECKEEWHDYIISAVVRKRKRIDLADFSHRQVKLKHEIEAYLRLFKYKKVAIWGASHQALTIISLLNLSDKIMYVIDSAAFKQGKFTPATHIPIVAPDKLYSDPADAVIVMAAGYSDEVAKIIRQKFNKNISISIVRNYGLDVIKP